LKQTRLFAMAAIAALLAACNGGGSTPPPFPPRTVQDDQRELTTLSTFVAQNNDTGELVRIFPTLDTIAAMRATQEGQRALQATSPLTYHGGPVQTAPKMYVVFWGSSWNNSTGDPSGVKARLTAFLGVIGGSRWLNSVTQYTQSNGQHVGNAAGSLAGSYVDTTSTPPRRPTQSQMAAEAAKAAAKYGDYSANAAYIVALPHGIKPSGFGTQYCAYHSSTTAAGHTIAWTNDPYFPDAGASCGAGSVNSPGTLDGVTIVAGHEQGETETDPFPNSGWLDSSGAENGDKCAWTNLINNPAAGGYPTQPLWSNSNNGCVQSY
jgi:serine protease